jgi:hypothetical protein
VKEVLSVKTEVSMELLTTIMERVVAFWRNRRFFQFRKFHCPLNVFRKPQTVSQLLFDCYFHHVIARSSDKKFIGLWVVRLTKMSKPVAGLLKRQLFFHFLVQQSR